MIRIENIKKILFKKIEKAFDWTADILSESPYDTYRMDYIWNVLYKYSINTNGEKFNGSASSSMIGFMVPSIEEISSYLGTLRLVVYVSKPKVKFVQKYNKLKDRLYLSKELYGDPNVYFKYMLEDLSSGYNVVKEGEVHYDIDNITNQLDDLYDQEKFRSNTLEKLYVQIKNKSINDTVDYIIDEIFQ